MNIFLVMKIKHSPKTNKNNLRYPNSLRIKSIVLAIYKKYIGEYCFLKTSSKQTLKIGYSNYKIIRREVGVKLRQFCHPSIFSSLLRGPPSDFHL